MKKTKNPMMRRATAAVGAGALLLAAGGVQAALQDRDLDGNGQVDAFYDTDLNITWLRDANVNGLMNWATAVAWVDGFSLGGYDDWRLPTADPACAVNGWCGKGAAGQAAARLCGAEKRRVPRPARLGARRDLTRRDV